MTIHTFICNPYSECTYVCTHHGVVYVIDPGMYTDKEKEDVHAYLTAHHLIPTYILITHSHPDHICGVEYLLTLYPSAYIVDHKHPFPQKDAGVVNTFPSIIPTPGHKDDSACFYFEDEGILFTGDTLFRESVGRTDLPTGDYTTLMQSLNRLTALPSDTIVYPGHGPQTTLGHEKQYNPFLAR